jgi:hypothetical protein
MLPFGQLTDADDNKFNGTHLQLTITGVSFECFK